MTMALLEAKEILKTLPHRFPMLLIDRVLECDDKTRVVAIKNLTINEPFFQGHFPDDPVMPGVLQIEAMAQAGGFLLLNTVENAETKVVYFMGIDGVRFRRPVLPGDQLRFELKMVSFRPWRCCAIAPSREHETVEHPATPSCLPISKGA